MLLKGKDLLASCLFVTPRERARARLLKMELFVERRTGRFVGVATTKNGVDPAVDHCGSRFRYVADPVLSFVEPARAPVGGTVLIRGVRFADSGLLACRFGTQVARGLHCTSTPSVRICGGARRGRFSTNARAQRPGLLRKSKLRSPRGSQNLHAPPRAAHVGGDVVLLRVFMATGFAFSSHAACRFGSVKVPARVLNGTLRPMPAVVGAPSNDVGKTTLSITLNGADFVDVSGFAVLYVAQARSSGKPGIRGGR